MVFDTLKPSIWLLLFTAVLASDFANPFLNFGSETELNNLHHLELSDIKANLGKTIAARSDLGSRQLQCKDPGYVPCPSQAGCCPAGDNCVEGGCCPANQVRCGAKCFNPTEGYCCQDGSRACPNGYDCVEGGCCPSGEARCPGTTKCYNPKKQKCCQQSGSVWGCDTSKDCCDVGYCADPTTERCCVGGACPKEDSCCGKQCCTPNGICGADGFCSAKATPTPTTSSSTSTYTSSSTRTVTTGKVESSTSTSASSTRIACQTSAVKRDIDLSKRQRPFPKCCLEETQSNGEKLPIWELSPKAGETDELIRSMCAGIAASQARRKISEPDYDPVDGEDVLTYAGGRGQRGTQAGCKGFCTQQNKGRARADRLECDEYPPASFYEGGGFSSRVCVPWYQNSGTQGPMLSRILAVCGLQKGQQLKVRIKGGCKNNNVRRQQSGSSNTQLDLSGKNDTLRDPYGDGSVTYVAVGLGELSLGRYEVAFSTDTDIDSAVVLNSAGDEYASTGSASGKNSLSFQVDDDLQVPVALIAFTSKKVTVQYNTTVNGTGKTSDGSNTDSLAFNKLLTIIGLLSLLVAIFL